MNSAVQKSSALEGANLGDGNPGAHRPPLTRRERREREREHDAVAAEPATDILATPTPTAERAPVARRLPPLKSVTSDVSTAPSRRRWLAKGFSLLAMTFAVGMAVATSVPANVLLTKSDMQSQVLAARVSPATGKAQALKAGSTTSETVARDGADVTSAEQVAALTHMRIANTFTNDPHGTIQWPFPVGVPISDGFGPRVAPTDGASTFHEGVDFAPGDGTPIQIVADGVVRQVVARDDNSCGVHVIIDHLIGGQLVSSEYCHMRVGSVRVSVGQQVKVADIVGLVGNTGVSTGAHLHFQILLGGTTPVDPFAWLTANAN